MKVLFESQHSTAKLKTGIEVIIRHVPPTALKRFVDHLPALTLSVESLPDPRRPFLIQSNELDPSTIREAPRNISRN